MRLGREAGVILKACRAGDRSLQLLVLNEEFLVSASHQLALITSLPFVHTARRYYRLNGLVRPTESGVGGLAVSRALTLSQVGRTWSFRGSKSRNKVSVGEPAEGSLQDSLRREPGKPLARAKGVCARGRESPDTARLCLSVGKWIKQKTFNNGSLGSCNDEERSQVRNQVRFALPVSHHVFERNLRQEIGMSA